MPRVVSTPSTAPLASRRKLPRTWIYLTHPLGHDPYDSYGSSYMVNTATLDLLKVREEIVNEWLLNQGRRVEVATAGIYESQPAAPFNGDPLL